MPALPVPVQNAIGGVVAGRTDYDTRVAARDAADRDLASAQHAKDAADAAVTGGASELNARIDAAEKLLDTYRPGSNPPADGGETPPTGDATPPA